MFERKFEQRVAFEFELIADLGAVVFQFLAEFCQSRLYQTLTTVP